MIIDAVIVTYNRENCITDAIDSLLQYRKDLGRIFVVVNGSTDGTVERLERYSEDPLVTVIETGKNLGAPGGKNIGMRKSEADVVVIIDDDAEFFTDDPINCVKNIFSRDSRLGIIQFKIVNHKSGQIMKYEFPGDDPAKHGNTEFEIGSFTGAGHAIRKSLLEDVGYYPDEYFYAHEELDLSFRAIRAGWSMRYIPTVGVYHKKNPLGRLPERDMIKRMVLNRMTISRQYLPFHYRAVSNTLWLLKAAIWSRSVLVPFEALGEYFRIKPGIRRLPLGRSALAYLRANHGRLWY